MDSIKKGTINVDEGVGGTQKSNKYNGGDGGSGSISIGYISTGTYVEYVESTSTE